MATISRKSVCVRKSRPPMKIGHVKGHVVTNWHKCHHQFPSSTHHYRICVTLGSNHCLENELCDKRKT